MDGIQHNSKLATSNIIKTLIVGMILFMSYITILSIITGRYDIIGMTVGTSFIFALIVLKWLLKESGIE